MLTFNTLHILFTFSTYCEEAINKYAFGLEKDEFSFIQNFVFFPSLKSHLLYFLYFELDSYILFHLRSFGMINKTFFDPILWLPSGYSYTGNYGHRRQVNRKSSERIEDDLPVPLIPSADKTIRRAEEIFST